MEVLIERIEPERYFAYRWHPYAIDPAVDYAHEPMTLVEFRLDEADGGTLLTIVESGFDQVPLARREKAFRMNDGDGPSRPGTSSAMSRSRSAAERRSLPRRRLCSLPWATRRA